MNLVPQDVLALAATIDPTGMAPPIAGDEMRSALATLAIAAFPTVEYQLQRDPGLLDACFLPAWFHPMTEARFTNLLASEMDLDREDPSRTLRRFAARHRLRIALREVLPDSAGGTSSQVAARELSNLASATIDAAFVLACREVETRFGIPMGRDQIRSTCCILGMGKLGGMELNAGSDVDLIPFYDTDEGATTGPKQVSLHEFWTRVVRRLVPILEEVTEDGFVWRVDLRLRPEGTQGPLVNSLPAMLRYYETWGRLWERSAWIRARPVAGDRSLGQTLIDEMQPFVYRRRVDPKLADAMCSLVEQARSERGDDVDRDLKLGLGGIRELEIFVQALQLIWGGVNETLRIRPTLEALDRLRSHGFVTDREATVLGEAYALLRRAEHLVQNATGLQTHSLPNDASARLRLARCLGMSCWQELDSHLREVRKQVHACIQDIRSFESRPPRWTQLFASIDQGDRRQVCLLLEEHLGEMATEVLAANLIQLGVHPEILLGVVARERAPEHAEALVDALVESADPELAAQTLRSCTSHRGFNHMHALALRERPALLRRFVTALGGSAFLGEMIARHTELAEHALFSRGMPSTEAVIQAVDQEVESLGPEGMLDPELVAGAIRRAKVRATLEIVLADMAGEVGVTDVTRVLSSLADRCVERALRAAAGQREAVRGICVLSVGKLGGRELGYGSDLDILFVFEPREKEDENDVMGRRAREAQRAIRILSGVHEQGPGFELDTRLRPSGSQGVLVTSLRAFARYHGLEGEAVGVRAAAFERQTLLRARFTAGDEDLGRRVMTLAHRAAYDGGPPDEVEIHRLRMRLEKELGSEKGGRFDIKLGRGGLVDIEFAVQTLQMLHGGKDPSVRTPNILEGIDALERQGVLASMSATHMREGYLFLRKLEQRLHVVHNTSIHLIEAQAPGMLPLARRMGLTGTPGRSAPEQLLSHYAAVTSSIRETYWEVMGIS